MKATIHQQARTDLLNIYGKYMNKRMYAELWNYTLKCEKESKLLELYKKIFTKLQFETETDSYDDSWGMSQDVEILKSSNKDVEMWTGDNDIIDLFNQIKALEEELKCLK